VICTGFCDLVFVFGPLICTERLTLPLLLYVLRSVVNHVNAQQGYHRSFASTAFLSGGVPQRLLLYCETAPRWSCFLKIKVKTWNGVINLTQTIQ